jgi:hypothetical protein
MVLVVGLTEGTTLLLLLLLLLVVVLQLLLLRSPLEGLASGG